MRQLLESGAHFGHRQQRWKPKKAPFIYGQRNDIHILDLTQTVPLLHRALVTLRDVAAGGGRILFVGTKRQASEPIAAAAKRCAQYYVNHRWLGGTLTNWSTLQKSIKRLKTLKAMTEDGRMAQLSKKEAARLDREMKHLKQNLSGVENMTALPDAMFVIDSHAEAIAVREARRMGVPVVSIVDTNCDPDQVDWVIPGNDDALRAIKLFTSKISDAVIEGRHAYERSQIADQKATADAVDGAEKVEYVDTSAYESYEKQEGDFVEPGTEPAAEPFAEPEPDTSVKGAAE
jgi:small subunit ribosomal protein S2